MRLDETSDPEPEAYPAMNWDKSIYDDRSTMIEERHQARGDLLRLLHDIAIAVNQSTRIERAVRYVIERVCAHSGWPVGHAFLVSEDGSGELEPTGIWYVQREAKLEPFKRLTMQTRFAKGEGLIGRVYQTGKPMWVRDVGRNPSWLRRNVGDLGLRSALIYPVSVEGRVIAVAEFYSSQESRPGPEMMSVMQTVGALLGQLFERKELEFQLAEMATEEQRRVGQELHDVIGQQVTALSFVAKNLERRLKESSEKEAEMAERLAQGIEETKGQIRALIEGLAPVGVEASGLPTLLEDMALRSGRLYGLECRVESDGRVDIRDDFKAGQLFRIVQEALHNAVKHGSADKAVVVLRRYKDRGVLKVSDNGTGFDPDALTEGMGLRIMRYRAGLIDGELSVWSRPGAGTVITCSFKQEQE